MLTHMEKDVLIALDRVDHVIPDKRFPSSVGREIDVPSLSYESQTR